MGFWPYLITFALYTEVKIPANGMLLFLSMVLREKWREDRSPLWWDLCKDPTQLYFPELINYKGENKR